MHGHKVVFQPEGRTVRSQPGQTLMDLARSAGIHLNAPCGSMGVCGNCRVILTKGESFPTPAEREILTEKELVQGVRLACQVQVGLADLVVLVPDQTRLWDQKILSVGLGTACNLNPSLTKLYLELLKPTIADPRTDLERLQQSLPPEEPLMKPVTLGLLRDLPDTLRKADFNVTAVLSQGELLAVEPGRTDNKLFGIAFDVGTTTVVGMLVDLKTGEELSSAGRTNPQAAFGDDVVSRIHFADTTPDGLARLQSAIIACMNDCIAEVCREAKVEPREVYELTVVGNTTMMHLLLGITPTYIARAPYVGVFQKGISVHAQELALAINPAGRIYVLPGIAGFVGADTVGVILAGNLYGDDRLRLAVDIGTNGEIVIGSSKQLLCCSTAAGPAFEGARIKFGMRAASGAIDAVDIDDDVRLHLISGTKPAGLCGTGLLDVVAELVRVGVIDETGRILAPEEIANLPMALVNRIKKADGSFEFVLAEHSTGDAPITLTQRDVREFQLAKGALAAGIAIMKKELNVTDDDIEEVLLAGAFGNYIRRERAVAVGLFGTELLDRIRFVGNAAGVGARMALMDREIRARAEEVSRQVRYVELAGRADFQEIFAEAMMLSANR